MIIYPKKNTSRYGFAAACPIVKGSFHVMCVKTFVHNGFLSPPTTHPTPYMYFPLLTIPPPSSLLGPFLIIVASYFVLLLLGKKGTKGYCCNYTLFSFVFLSFAFYFFSWGKPIANIWMSSKFYVPLFIPPLCHLLPFL
jgi:hypothetical protein